MPSKRKASSQPPPPGKRRRRSSADNDASEISSSGFESDDEGADILSLEQEILSSKKNYNKITILLEDANPKENDDSRSLVAAVALCRVFIQLLGRGSLIFKTSSSDKDAVVVGWLRDQLRQLRATLLIHLSSLNTAMPALILCMRIIKAESQFLHDGADYNFSRRFLEEVVSTILHSDDAEIRETFVTDFAGAYDDVRFYTFTSVQAILQADGVPKDMFVRSSVLLAALDGVPEAAGDLTDFYVPRPKQKKHPLYSVTQHKKQGQQAWLATLKHATTREHRKQVLNIMSTTIAPWFTSPELLADFLADCYDEGGSMSLLALSGVFYLIRERNLDYPSFYPKLYSLLDRDILHSKHRSRFLRQLDTFLASTHLPAALVASFIKRLSRLGLNAPPSAIVVIVPWIYNLLKQHPLCTFMIHRETHDISLKEAMSQDGVTDTFLPDEPDPMKTGAIDSCLWELVQLQSHYHPNVATIVKIISEQFTKQAYNMEDFLDHSYTSLLDAELGKETKKAPVVEFHIPKRVLLIESHPNDATDKLIAKLWNFNTIQDTEAVS